MKKITHQEIKNTLHQWTLSGHKLFPDGTELIGKARHIGEQAWIHEPYAPPKVPIHDKLLHHIPNIFDFEIGKILLHLNGMNLFSSHLFIYGPRSDYSRVKNVFQPWEITTHHLEKMHNLNGRNAIIFGGSEALPDSISFVENSDGTVDAFDRNNWREPMHRWESFHDFIRNKIARLSSLFDAIGKPINDTMLADFGNAR